ncbi:hypothetical protein Mapa_015320 [Marchantia paleacea]|nr:hypothetical protein Mapa_015320 [Marchantia paleacea]
MAMVMASSLPSPAPPSKELVQSWVRKCPSANRSTKRTHMRFDKPSPYLQFCSSRRRSLGVGTAVAVARSSVEDGEDGDGTEHESLVLGGYDNSACPVEHFVEKKPETKSFLERWIAKLQLVGVLIALGMVIGVRVATASATGAPIDGKKKKYSIWSSRPLNSSIVMSDGSDAGSREMSTADLHDREDPRRINESIIEGTAWSRDEFHGIVQHQAVQRNAALAAETDGNDEEARREYEEWKATPYALTVPLRLVGLRGSVPPVWLKDFSSSQGKRAKVVAEFQGNLQNIFTDLSTALSSKQLTPKSALSADLVTIGDSWVGRAVSGGLITPIENVEKYEWFQRLGTTWQTYLRRNEFGDVDPNGKVWAVPYRWGKVVIAFNRQKLQQHGIPMIEDWDDLWKPELAGRIAMISSPRDVVGAVLKALGASYNVKDFETDVPGGRQAVAEKFRSLQKQVRLFDNIQYLKTLGAGEVWVAVGWSGDVIPFAKRTSNITIITPRSGTSLWADLWAIPATPPKSTKVGGRVRGPSPLCHQWLDFCLQSARATSFKEDVFVGASPLVLAGKSCGEIPSSESVDYADISLEQVSNVKRDESAESDEENPPSSTMMEDSLSHNPIGRNEFLEPLSPTARDDFKWLLSRSAELPKSGLKSLAQKFQNLFSSTRRTIGS